MPLDPQAQAFLDIVAGAPPLDTQTAAANRHDLANALPLTGEPADIASVEDTAIDGPGGAIPVRMYRPHPEQVSGVVVYLHGGGWVLGTLDVFDATVREIAAASHLMAISVDYRLAPEHPFPAALEDAMAVTRAVLSGNVPGADPQRVAVAGDSAGGNLAAVVAQQLRVESGLRHQALIYPVTQARVGLTDSYREFADGYFLTARDMQYFIDAYAAEVDPDDPRLAPAAAGNLTGLAPATVITAECDPLRDEGEAYAAAMQRAGVEVELRRFDGQVHPFVAMGGVIDDASVARRYLADRIASALKI